MEDENEDVRTALSGAAAGPPLGIDAASIIERGGRIRRRRKRLAVAGSTAATVAVIAGVALTAGLRGTSGPSEPVQPAGPNLSVTKVEPPPSPSVQPSESAGPTPGTAPIATDQIPPRPAGSLTKAPADPSRAVPAPTRTSPTHALTPSMPPTAAPR